MEFMLQQQAQHDARMQQIEEIIVSLARGTRDRFGATDKRLDDVDVKIAALVDAQTRTEDSVKKTDEALRALVDVQTRTEESAKKTDEAIKETQESVKNTAEALRTLIAVCVRYFEDRKGGSGTLSNSEQ